eukprot:TRINITY_DN2222_c0_g1_i2.p2 TRINITY_DN2222_c0_g1~~TRINITY_DN2222_c0_g1_i2.p2  ORF type:complete len:174 (-),score=54.79 TRINITY_DN2222_c0_g1_i2:84-605(-)
MRLAKDRIVQKGVEPFLAEADAELARMLGAFNDLGVPFHTKTVVATLHDVLQRKIAEANFKAIEVGSLQFDATDARFQMKINYSRPLRFEVFQRRAPVVSSITHGTPERRLFHVYVDYDRAAMRLRAWKPQQCLEGAEGRGYPFAALVRWDLWFDTVFNAGELELVARLGIEQ